MFVLVVMAIQPFGVRVREKKEPRKKKRKWLTASTLINIILLIITLVSVSTTYYFSTQNVTLQNEIYNFTPFIYSNYSDSATLQNILPVNVSYNFFEGFVDVNLRIVTPYDGMLTILPQYINFSTGSDSSVPYYFNTTLLKYSYVSFFPSYSANQYQYFISKNVMNPIQDKLWIEVNTYLNSEELSYLFRDQGENTTTRIGFPLGNITFQATLFEAQKERNFTQDFTEGAYCQINNNP